MKRQKLPTLILGLCLSFLLALPALAELDDEGNDMSLAEEDFYLGEGVVTDNGDDEIEFGNFDPETSATTSGSCTPIRSIYNYDQNFGWRWSTGGTAWFDCSGDIPQGARLMFVGVEAYDNGGGATWLFVHEFDFLSSGFTTLASAQTSGASTARRYLTTSIFNRTVNLLTNSYSARVRVDGGSLFQFRSVFFVYVRQLSPKPGFATFGDVPLAHPYHRAIQALYASRITVGCGGGNFCPERNLTRGEMAVFLAKALGLHWW